MDKVREALEKALNCIELQNMHSYDEQPTVEIAIANGYWCKMAIDARAAILNALATPPAKVLVDVVVKLPTPETTSEPPFDIQAYQVLSSVVSLALGKVHEGDTVRVRVTEELGEEGG